MLRNRTKQHTLTAHKVGTDGCSYRLGFIKRYQSMANSCRSGGTLPGATGTGCDVLYSGLRTRLNERSHSRPVNGAVGRYRTQRSSRELDTNSRFVPVHLLPCLITTHKGNSTRLSTSRCPTQSLAINRTVGAEVQWCEKPGHQTGEVTGSTRREPI